jgi:hypothetical protein
MTPLDYQYPLCTFEYLSHKLSVHSLNHFTQWLELCFPTYGVNYTVDRIEITNGDDTYSDVDLGLIIKSFWTLSLD